MNAKSAPKAKGGSAGVLARVKSWATGSKFLAAGQLIALVTSSISDLHATLRTASSMIEQVEIKLPGH